MFSEKLVNELHYCIEKYPFAILSPNVSDSVFVKINGSLVKKQSYIIQISVWELHNDMILPLSQGGPFGAINVDNKVCIVDTSLRKYITKLIKPMSNINKITCECKTFISAMLFQSYLNKWRLSQLAKIDKLYIISA